MGKEGWEGVEQKVGFAKEVEGKGVEEGVGSVVEEVVEGKGVEQREESFQIAEEEEEAGVAANNEGFEETDL
jgi:hypothetical protein